jgi:hypothetical protein
MTTKTVSSSFGRTRSCGKTYEWGPQERQFSRVQTLQQLVGRGWSGKLRRLRHPRWREERRSWPTAAIVQQSVGQLRAGD